MDRNKDLVIFILPTYLVSGESGYLLRGQGELELQRNLKYLRPIVFSQCVLYWEVVLFGGLILKEMILLAIKSLYCIPGYEQKINCNLSVTPCSCVVSDRKYTHQPSVMEKALFVKLSLSTSQQAGVQQAEDSILMVSQAPGCCLQGGGEEEIYRWARRKLKRVCS